MTKYTLVTSLPYWLVAFVDNVLILLANMTGRDVFSFIAPVKDNDNEPQTNQAA
jgi:hypothetical protein